MPNNFAVLIYPDQETVLHNAFQARLGVEKPVVEIMESLNVINYESEAGEDCRAYALVVPVKESPMSGLGEQFGMLLPGLRWQRAASNVFAYLNDGVQVIKLRLPEIPACAVNDIFTDLKVCHTAIGHNITTSARHETKFDYARWHAAQYFKTPYFDVTEEQLRFARIASKVSDFIAEMEVMNVFISDTKLLAYVIENHTVGAPVE